MAALRRKSQELTGFFIDLVETRCTGHDLTLITPRDAEARGSQVSFKHPTGGYAIISALIAEGVIGDFRAPDVLRSDSPSTHDLKMSGLRLTGWPLFSKTGAGTHQNSMPARR